MTAWKNLSAALVTGQPIAWSRARHRAIALMLARPDTWLYAWRAGLMTFLGTLVVLAAYLWFVSKRKDVAAQVQKKCNTGA
jgi:hypothetical protein